MPVFENERGTYIFNSKDLCMVDHLPEMLEAGIDSLKIEGRMKTALYVATVARTTRKAIDDYIQDKDLYRKGLPWYREEIRKCTHRQFTTGFYFGKPSQETQIYDSSTYVSEYTYLGYAGRILDQGDALMEQKNKFSVGDAIEIMRPGGENLPVKVLSMWDEDGNPISACPHARQIFRVRLSEPLKQYDILRVKKE